MNLLTDIKNFYKSRHQRNKMERAKKLADIRAKETGKTHYVIMGPDEKPLVLNSQVARVLKKRHLMHKDTFLPREAVYIASF